MILLILNRVLKRKEVNTMANTAEIKLSNDTKHKILVLAREFFAQPENARRFNEWQAKNKSLENLPDRKEA